jgi:hypothetical protein
MPEQNNETTEDHGATLASWEYPEFIKHQRTKTWYIAAAVVIGLLVLFGIWTSSYLFIVIIGIVVFIYLSRWRREPTTLTCSITEDGILADPHSFYEWKDLRNFWIIYEPPEVKHLCLAFKSSIKPSITISLENQNPLNIRKILLEYIPEDTEKENESFADGMTRILKL